MTSPSTFGISTPVVNSTMSQSSFASSSVSSPSKPVDPSKFQISIELTERNFTEDLLNEASSEFKTLGEELVRALQSIKLDANFSLIRCRPGSVIATLDVITTVSSSSLTAKIEGEVRSRILGNFNVLPTLIRIDDAFEVSFTIKDNCLSAYLNKSTSSYRTLSTSVADAVNEVTNITNATVKNVKCLSEEETAVLVLVQVTGPSSPFPDEALKTLKAKVQLGNLSGIAVVSESWEANKAGQMRTFQVSLSVINSSLKAEDLKKEIQTILGNRIDYIYSNVNITDGKAIISIGMHPRSSPMPDKALKPLKEAVEDGEISGVKQDSYRARITSQLNEQVYDIQFYHPKLNCRHATLHDESVKAEVETFITDTLKKQNGEEFKGVSKVELLECTPNAVQTRVRVAMKRTVLLGDFYNSLFDTYCKKARTQGGSIKVTSLTPTAGAALTRSGPCPTTTTAPTTAPGLPSTSAPDKLPKLYVKLALDMTWREFCNKSIDQKLKIKIAENVRNKKGEPISPRQVVFFNKKERCNDPMKQDEQVDLWFYISHASGSTKLARCLTLQAFKKLRKFLDDDDTDKLGPEVEGKVCLSVRPSICMTAFVCLPACWSVCPSVYLVVCLSQLFSSVVFLSSLTCLPHLLFTCLTLIGILATTVSYDVFGRWLMSGWAAVMPPST